ncbi:two-component sensor histidine kinase, partial [Brevibacillus sp. MS2.2]|nr:two-component sensor histidine kinase [Brevibacillus sp. MS2.2]
MKIKNKIHLFSTVALLLLLLMVNSFIYFMFYKVTTDGELDRLQREVLHIQSGLNQIGVESFDPATLLQPYLPSNGMIRIIDQQSRAIVTQEVDSTQPIPAPKPIFDRKASDGVFDVNGAKYAYVKVPIIWTNGKI